MLQDLFSRTPSITFGYDRVFILRVDLSILQVYLLDIIASHASVVLHFPDLVQSLLERFFSLAIGLVQFRHKHLILLIQLDCNLLVGLVRYLGVR